jgi:hypothetical protein
LPRNLDDVTDAYGLAIVRFLPDSLAKAFVVKVLKMRHVVYARRGMEMRDTLVVYGDCHVMLWSIEERKLENWNKRIIANLE